MADAATKPPPAEGEVIGHGAEARVYRATFCGRACVVKERVLKRYRHPSLEASLSKKRLNQEARCLLRSRKSGVVVPCVYHIDYETKRMYMSLVEGDTLKAWICSLPSEADLKAALKDVGRSIGKLHDADVVHGDLTSSNVMLLAADRAPCIIDFGLSYVSTLVEDKAVDLYVMERALESTHTQEGLMAMVLVGYRQSKRHQGTLLKLADVRMRGRKRVMVG
ncbi:kinase-like domain-containing protein [Baffinella frigidus]|nr:kinase-like domain-containing protein [Cryptophyta sp. CCMP2293]